MGIVVDDLAAATAFFVEFGLKLQGEGPVEGGWVDRARWRGGARACFAAAAHIVGCRLEERIGVGGISRRWTGRRFVRGARQGPGAPSVGCSCAGSR